MVIVQSKRAHTQPHIHANLKCLYSNSDCSISPHAVAESMAGFRRCTILGIGGRSILGHNTHGNFERSGPKKMFNVQSCGVYSEKVHLYGKVECMSTNRSKSEGVRSEEVFNLTRFTVTPLSSWYMAPCNIPKE